MARGRNIAGPFAIHDPCTGGMRLRCSARRAASRPASALVRELSGAELTTCCGFGGLASFANPEVTGKIVDRRIGGERRRLSDLLRDVPG